MGPVRSSIAILLSGITLIAGCSDRSDYPNRPITLVCPWGAGGGTDRCSRSVAMHLESELGVPVNVINATGGKGVTGHSRGLSARGDGYTITMATLELSMMHWNGLTSLTYQHCRPLMSINEDYAAILTRTDAPFTELSQLEAAIRERPGELKASGTSSGGAWHLAIAGWLLALDMKADDVVWVSSTGAGPSLQELMSGGLDFVCCSLPEALNEMNSGQVRALGVMSPRRAQGFEDVPTFVESGTDWSLGGWRALAVPKGTPEPVVQQLETALLRIMDGQTKVADKSFPEFMGDARFDNTVRTGDELVQFLSDADEKFGKLLTSEAMRSVNEDPYPPMAFPTAIMFGMVGVLVAGVILSKGSGRPRASTHREPIDRVGLLKLLGVVALSAGYVIIVERVGFLLASGLLLLSLGVLMRVKPWIALFVSVLLPVTIYGLFVFGLRVPLPRGWLGW